MEGEPTFFPHESSEPMPHSSHAFAEELVSQIQSGEINIFELSDDQVKLLQKWSSDGEVELRQHAA